MRGHVPSAQLLRRRADEHIAREQIVPGVGVDDADRQAVGGIGADDINPARKVRGP